MRCKPAHVWAEGKVTLAAEKPPSPLQSFRTIVFSPVSAALHRPFSLSANTCVQRSNVLPR